MSNPDIVDVYRENKPAGGLLKGLSYVTAAIGAIAVVLAVIAIASDGLTTEGGLNAIILASGIGILLTSTFIWAAGKALELLSRIALNTKTK
jgi:hypothetical protein